MREQEPFKGEAFGASTIALRRRLFFARRAIIKRRFFSLLPLTSADARRLLRRSRRLLLLLLRLGLLRNSPNGGSHCDDGLCAGHFLRARKKKVEQKRRQFSFRKK